MPPKSVLLSSGGLDSTTLAYWLVEREIDFTPLFLNYGQHCAATERETLARVLPRYYADKIETVNISDIYKRSSSRLIQEANLWSDNVRYEELYLPYRNLLMLSAGSAYVQSIGGEDLYAGFINSNHAKEIDCSADFFEQLAHLLSEFGSVKIKMPFRFLTKYEVALEAIRLKAPIGYTFSCQVSSFVPCGACPNCVDRLDALKKISEEKGY
jgi:7-cyano-7-deazaguanine synthase